MNHLYRLSVLCILSLTIILTACKKDKVSPDPIPDNPSENFVTASVNGIVKDEQGNPVSGAEVKLGAYTTATNTYGLFFFHNVTTSERTSTVVVSKSGFFNGSRTFFVKQGNTSSVKIRLLSKGTAENFNASSGGTVNFTGGLSISFPANGIVVKETGIAYNGQVNVYAKKIDPTTDEGLESMPGDLRGINSDGEERLLQSFGMMVAELYDDSGNALQIANNSSATMSLTVPSSLQASAPSSIPLWYYNEDKGMWMEEGIASLQGDKYVANVKHFSFWNCDTPAAAIELEVCFVDQNGIPFQHCEVKLTNSANLDSRYGLTNSGGWVKGLVYSNATLEMEVFCTTNCGDSQFYSQTVVTGSSNLNLGTISITVVNSNASTIVANIFDCNNNLLSNGSIFIPEFDIILVPDENGNITYSFPCLETTDVNVVTSDHTTNVYGLGTYSLHSGMNNLGDLSACGNESPFFNVSITNDLTFETEILNTQVPTDYVGTYNLTNGLMIAADFVSQSRSVSIRTIGYEMGNLPLSGGGFAIDTSVVTELPDKNFHFNSVGSSCTFTSVPTIGNAEGTFVLHLTGWDTGQPYTVTGSFRVQKF